MANKWSLSPRSKNEPTAIKGTRWIPLTQDKWALVDEGDYPLVSKYTWCYIKGRHDGVSGYTQTNIHQEDGSYKRISMHRLITGFIGQIDHKDSDGLNNRRANLRFVSDTQNRRNSNIYKNNKTGFKGVSRTNKGRTWRANIAINKKQTHLGTFNTPEEAARAYDAAAIEHFGEFAKLNFPGEQ